MNDLRLCHFLPVKIRLVLKFSEGVKQLVLRLTALCFSVSSIWGNWLGPVIARLGYGIVYIDPA